MRQTANIYLGLCNQHMSNTNHSPPIDPFRLLTLSLPTRRKVSSSGVPRIPKIWLSWSTSICIEWVMAQIVCIYIHWLTVSAFEKGLSTKHLSKNATNWPHVNCQQIKNVNRHHQLKGKKKSTYWLLCSSGSSTWFQVLDTSEWQHIPS